MYVHHWAQASLLTSLIVGRVNLCSPDHISLLVHKTFNVSIPRHHIPTDNWEFEYGPAENDPEFGQDEPQADVEGDGDDDQPIDHSSGGRWVHRVTGEVLGDLIEFTVIGCESFSLVKKASNLIQGLLLRMRCFLFLVHCNPIHSPLGMSFRVSRTYRTKMGPTLKVTLTWAWRVMNLYPKRLRIVTRTLSKD